MATINLGRIKPVFRGAYSGATAYVVDDIVTSGGSSYICIQAHGAGTQAVTVTAYWSVLASTGTDVGTTITTQGDILYRDGSGLQRLAKPASNKYLQNTSGGVLSWEALTEYNDDKVQNNIALLGFKCAVNGSLAKYNLVDQIIDEYSDATGIDAGNSTNEALTAGAYIGGTAPTISHDADATGTDGAYTWYKWTDTAATGSYETNTTQAHEYLIVGGGGAGGEQNAGGGGGGGVLAATGLSLTGGNTYTTTVGAGGAAVGASSTGNAGSDSILSGTGISTLTAGGGGGGGTGSGAGTAGRATNGNGGGAGYNNASAAAGDGAGFAGGAQTAGSPAHGPGGGGGAAEVGENGTSSKGGDGGDGVANDIIETGTNVYYAGGGGSGADNNQASCGAGGNGGGGTGDWNGGAGAARHATANTGGGGGGSHHSTDASGAGGSGIVILRRLTTVAGDDLTLQSTANTASATATKGDMIMLMENFAGTATLNTDIKGYISANGGSNWTEGTLVDEGTWGTNKKILAFHDQTIANSGTDIRYKITTHNQSLGSKETKIHATSIGWA